MSTQSVFDWAGYKEHLAAGGAPFGGRFNATIAEATDTFRELVAERARYRQALREIRDQDWVENTLDPQWAARIASVALDQGRAA